MCEAYFYSLFFSTWNKGRALPDAVMNSEVMIAQAVRIFVGVAEFLLL